MRLALRGMLVAAAVATTFVTAAPASAAICIDYSDRVIYSGSAGTVQVPAPTRVDPSCTVTAVLELVQ